MRQDFKITGMSCSACSTRIEKVLNHQKGIRSANVNLLRNRMLVEFDAEIISIEEICKKIDAIGFNAEPFSPSLQNNTNTLNNAELDKIKKRFLYSLLLMIPLFIISMAPMLGLPELPVPWNQWCQVALCLPILIINSEYFVRGYKNLFLLHPNMDSLVALSATASFISQYYDSAAMITTLITLGKFLEERAKNNTTDAITGLIKLTPPNALVTRHGEEGEIPVEELLLDDTVIVKSGYRVPTDGIIINGQASFDESAITGESKPILHIHNDTITGGTLCIDGEIQMKVTALGENTTLASIIRLVDEATTSKAPVATLADKISGVFVPCIILIALATAAVWSYLGANTDFILKTSISVLVISCPCALGLATPTAIMVGVGLGAQHGILIKSATALQLANDTDTIVLDKTGTITEGKLDLNNTDKIKANSIPAIETIKKLHKNVIMLSGDKEETAKKIAQQAKVNTYYSQCMPSDKERIIRQLQNDQHIVMMVGDGINDAPALSRADIGVSIGSGTDVAIESADVVLMKSDLRDIITLLKLSKETLKCIKQNLLWAFFYNVICIPVAAGCLYSNFGILLNPMFGAAAMSCSSLSVITNALRLKSIKL